MSENKPIDNQHISPAPPARPEPLRDDFHQEALRVAREINQANRAPREQNPEALAQRNNVPPPIVRGEGYRAALEAHRAIPPSERGR